ELLHPRPDESPDQVLSSDLQCMVGKAVEGTEADEGDDLRAERVATGRQHEDLADLTVEHPAPGHLLDGAIQSRIVCTGSARRRNALEDAERNRARVRLRDAAERKAQVQPMLLPPPHDDLLEAVRVAGRDGGRRRVD